jgi:cytidyltransferase-like protein
MTKVLTIGTFDMLHAGHIELFVESAKLGELHVAINPDDFVERYKGKKPVMSELDRICVISHIREVHKVAMNYGQENARLIIGSVKPDIITIGDDWYDSNSKTPEARYHRQLGVTQTWLDNRHIKIIYLPRTMGRSSRKIRENL